MHIIDRTAYSAVITETRNGRRILGRGGTSQAISQLRGVFLHQTDFFNPNHGRYDHIITHFAVLRTGDVLKIREPTVALNSVSNGRAVDVEFEGSYPSMDQIRRLRRADVSIPHPTVAQVLAGRALIQHLRDSLGLVHVWAHRQASRMQRDRCPGPHLWYNVGEWALDELGLNSGGLGQSVPLEWRTTRELDVVWPSPLPDPWSDDRFNEMVSRLRGPF